MNPERGGADQLNDQILIINNDQTAEEKKTEDTLDLYIIRGLLYSVYRKSISKLTM